MVGSCSATPAEVMAVSMATYPLVHIHFHGKDLKYSYLVEPGFLKTVEDDKESVTLEA